MELVKNAIEYVKEKVNIEINSATDNPLIFNEEKQYQVEIFMGSQWH